MHTGNASPFIPAGRQKGPASAIAIALGANLGGARGQRAAVDWGRGGGEGEEQKQDHVDQIHFKMGFNTYGYTNTRRSAG